MLIFEYGIKSYPVRDLVQQAVYSIAIQSFKRMLNSEFDILNKNRLLLTAT